MYKWIGRIKKFESVEISHFLEWNLDPVLIIFDQIWLKVVIIILKTSLFDTWQAFIFCRSLRCKNISCGISLGAAIKGSLTDIGIGWCTSIDFTFGRIIEALGDQCGDQIYVTQTKQIVIRQRDKNIYF